MTTLIALAERVEGLSGPDREVDALVFRALDFALPKEFASYGIKLTWQPDGSATMPMGDMQVRYEPPAFTASLDAVCTLIAEKLPEAESLSGHSPARRAHRRGYGSITLLDEPPYVVFAATPALALLAATLRALSKDTER